MPPVRHLSAQPGAWVLTIRGLLHFVELSYYPIQSAIEP